jgi:hypothetical protein
MIDITVVDVSGSRQQPASVPDDMAVARVIARLIVMMDLPQVGPDGGPLSYRFHHKAKGRQLADHETLAGAGVRPDDVLRLQPEIIAGARR